MVDGNGRFLITDFGISKRLRATMRRQSKRDVSSGAMPYMAPERFESNPKLNTASDIWSLGASIYELATGELPFSGFGGAMQRNGAEIPNLPPCYSKDLNALMQRCLSLDEQTRPSTAELKLISNSIVSDTCLISKLTDLDIEQPEDNIQLSIRGYITDVTIQPKFDNKFGVVWSGVISCVVCLIFGISYVYLFRDGIVSELLRILLVNGVVFACFVGMWLTGYYQVKRWNAIGKYLMCGAIYIMIYLMLWGFYHMINDMINSLMHQPNNFINKDHWYDNVALIIGLSLIHI